MCCVCKKEQSVWSPLDYNDIEFLKKALAKLNYSFSEYSCANLILFRESHKYELFPCPENPMLKGLTYDKQRYVMPLFHPHQINDRSKELIDSMMKEGYSLFPVGEEWCEVFNNSKYQIEFREEDSDYMYHIEKLRRFPGRKLHKKRNLVKQFRSNNYSDVAVGPDNLKDCFYILNLWQKGSSQHIDDTDYNSCSEYLTHGNSFSDITGLVSYVDGEPAGFILGEKNSRTLYSVHFAKGAVQYKGIYQHLFQAYAQSLDTAEEEEVFINLEQDLGHESLRKTKRSYIPDEMLHKNRISLK